MKQKLTLQQKLDRVKFKKPNRIVMIAYRLLNKLVLEKPYDLKYTIVDDIRKCKGPCFLVYNHLSRGDHIFFSGASYPRKLNILAGHNEQFRNAFHQVFRLMRVIPKKNYTTDIPSIKAMTKIIQLGGCVCFSPEGMSSIYGTNQPVVPGTAHFFKHFGIPVYFLQLRGSYLTSNKICIDIRPGKVEAELKVLFTPEQLKEMSEEEIDLKINTAFRHDDYEWNKTARSEYKSNGKICTRLNDICYQCPKCGSIMTMNAEGDHIECTKCGNGAKMNDYYDFIPYNDSCVIPESPSKWVAWERVNVIKEIRENPNFTFSTNVKVGYLPPYELVPKKQTSVPCGEGVVTIDHNGIHFKGVKLGQEWNWDLSYKTIYSLVIVNDLAYFSLYINGEYHDFFPDTQCVGRMLLLVEEMHRYHFNIWKNFPWNDYMYVGTELEKKSETK